MNVDLLEAKVSLQQWLSPQEFCRKAEQYRNAIPSGSLFKSPGHQFLFEAWTACEFVGLTNCDHLRLTNDDWPDLQICYGGVVKGYEIAEVLEPGRKRGAEDWSNDSVISDNEANWHRRAALIPRALRAGTASKVAKHYPRNMAALLIYLNIHEWGVKQREIEADLHDATALAKDDFTDVWVLWKHKLYHVWQDGQYSTVTYEKKLTLEDF